jgi:hypothetical protein
MTKLFMISFDNFIHKKSTPRLRCRGNPNSPKVWVKLLRIYERFHYY